MISLNKKGDFSRTSKFLKKMKELNQLKMLDKYGREGVSALAANTPVESGLTSTSWYYEIRRKGDRVSLVWLNSNINEGVPIAIILQYGHGTGTGGWVEGRDYINPAICPVFDKILNELRKEVTSA